MSNTITQGNRPYINDNLVHKDKANVSECPQLPGTILRIFIPAGAVINLLNLIEIASPSGICLVVRIPVLGGSGFDSIVDTIKNAGGTVEFIKA